MAKKTGKYQAAPARRFPWGKGVLVVVLLLLMCSSAALAYYIRTSGEVSVGLEPVYVSCTIDETVEDNSKTSIQVRNTSDIPAYIRVRLVSYWKNPSGTIAGRTAQVPAIALGEGWIADKDNNTFYCTQSVAAGGETPELLESPLTLVTEDGYIQVVEVLAEAIQAQPAGAVTEAWPVTVTNGSLSLK